jgi:threonyl-tRNA synthetase
VQALVIPIADRHAAYGREVLGALLQAGVRAEIDERGESMGRRIRDGQLQKVPYLLVVGDREAEGGAVGVRERGEDKGPRPLAEFVDQLLSEVRDRRLP